jgi:carbonic anhydrase
LALIDGQPAGCVGLHAFSGDIAEIKRLYVKPEFRGHRLGRQLADKVIAEAKKIGYTRLRLDTIEEKMRTAVAMYRAMGFREIAPYRENPIPSALYMELSLEEPNTKTQRHRA